MDSSVPGKRSWSGGQLEVEQDNAEMSREGRVVQVQQVSSPFSFEASSPSFRFGSLEDFFAPALPSGTELRGPLWSPYRLLVNVCLW